MSGIYIPIGKDYKVNDKLTIKAVPLRVKSCSDCALLTMISASGCEKFSCADADREDNQNVYFVAVPPAQPKPQLTDEEITELALKAGFGRSSYTDSIVANSPLGGVPVTDELREFARLIQEKLEK